MIVEVIACSANDALAAEAGGATRLEICSAIELGGVTPSMGMVEAILAATRLPIVVMVRPRPGGFCYESSDVETMCRDIAGFVRCGVHAVVTGANLATQVLDSESWKRFKSAAENMPLVCHRSFDELADFSLGYSQLLELGIERVLTSGGAKTAGEGADLLAQLIKRGEKGGGIEVLPGGRIRPENVADLIRRTGARQVHASTFLPSAGDDPKSSYGPHLRIDIQQVRALVAAANLG